MSNGQMALFPVEGEATEPEALRFDVGVLRPSEIGPLWPQIRELLKLALEHSMPIEPEAFYADALQYKAQIWVVWSVGKEPKMVGAAVTSRTEHGGGNMVLRVILLAGRNFNQWKPQIISKFETFARNTECRAIEAVGRKGWGKHLDEYGFRPKYVTFVKELPDE
jgi:hypothetical protein